MADEADEWETPPMKTGIIPLPPLPDPQLPPGSWATAQRRDIGVC